MSRKNLTEYVRNFIFRHILEGVYSPGEKLPPEREMAVITGTSRITVRAAYRELENIGVIMRKQGIGTMVANTFKAHAVAGSEVGLITTIHEPFAVDFIEAAERAVTQNDTLLVLTLTNNEYDDVDAAMRLVGKEIRNIIVWGTNRLNDALFERLRVLGVNIVFFDRIIPGSYADFVGLDNDHAINTIVADAAVGCRQLIFLDAAPIDYDSNRERGAAFTAAVKTIPGIYTEKIVCRGKDAAAQAIAELTDFLNRNVPPNDIEKLAVICVNDDLALQVNSALPQLADRGRLYGIDGRDNALQNGIISYRQPITAMAETVVEALNIQCNSGKKWRAKQIRCRGELLRP